MGIYMSTAKSRQRSGMPLSSYSPRSRTVRIFDRGPELDFSRDAEKKSPEQLWAFAYLALRRLVELFVLLVRSDVPKEIELLVLHRDLAVIRRHVKRRSFEPADRALLAAHSVGDVSSR
jgi:hypothetical protein